MRRGLVHVLCKSLVRRPCAGMGLECCGVSCAGAGDWLKASWLWVGAGNAKQDATSTIGNPHFVCGPLKGCGPPGYPNISELLQHLVRVLCVLSAPTYPQSARNANSVPDAADSVQRRIHFFVSVSALSVADLAHDILEGEKSGQSLAAC